MKVAVLGTRGIPADYSGVEKRTEEILTRLVNDNIHFIVYCWPYQKHKRFENNKIKRVFIPVIPTKHLATFTHTLLSSLHVIFFSKADIVHYHSLGPSLFSLIPKIFGKKTVVTVHGLDWKRKKWGLLAKAVLRIGEYFSVIFPSKTVVVSKKLKNYYAKRYKRRVYYIPNGVGLSEHNNINLSLFKKYNLEKNKYLLFVGRLVPEKGIHYLISAYNKIDTDMKLLIVGEHSFTKKYKRDLFKINSSKILFLGRLNSKHLGAFYKYTYLYVLPSEVEGLSISILEAMSYGKCVLTADIDECREVIGSCGYTFKNGNSKDLEMKLQMLIDNPQLVKETGIKAKRRVKKFYNWDNIGKKKNKLYLSLSQ